MSALSSHDDFTGLNLFVGLVGDEGSFSCCSPAASVVIDKVERDRVCKDFRNPVLTPPGDGGPPARIT